MVVPAQIGCPNQHFMQKRFFIHTVLSSQSFISNHHHMHFDRKRLSPMRNTGRSDPRRKTREELVDSPFTSTTTFISIEESNKRSNKYTTGSGPNPRTGMHTTLNVAELYDPISFQERTSHENIPLYNVIYFISVNCNLPANDIMSMFQKKERILMKKQA